MDVLLGQIISVGYFRQNLAGFARCDGSTLDIKSNVALFSLLGNNYGGDGVKTFCLPDLTASDKATGLHSFIALEGDYPQFE